MTSRASRTGSNYQRGFVATAATLCAVVLTACALLCGCALPARAQSPTATLSGTVSDEAGAFVPGVRLTLLNLNTAVERHATTDEEGRFAVPLLQPGRYTATARREGFSAVEVRDVVLNVGDQLALRIRLRVGEISETVTVFGAEAGAASSVSPSASTVVDRRFVENLPLSGRSFQTLFELTPGTVLTRASFNDQGQFSASGQRANANYFTVDGVSANVGVSAGAAPGQAAGGTLPALTALGGTNNLVAVEALEEFRVQTSSYAPEFGRTSGAQVQLVTRSGTNELHGSLFEYFRHGALDANDWFANRRGLARPRVRQHDFGGAAGGPLVKDRIFFFASYEGLRLRQPQVALTEVPSLAARTAAPAGVRPFLEAFPVPNGRATRDGLAEFAASYTDPSRLDAASLRLDALAGEKLTLFGRYNRAPSEVTQRGRIVSPSFNVRPLINPTLALALNNLSRARFLTETVTLGATYAAAPHVTNDLRANYSRAQGATSFSLDDFGGALPPPASLLFPPAADTSDASFQLLLGEGANVPGLWTGENVNNWQRQINVVNNLSVVAGAHQLKFGVDYRRLAPVYDPVGYNQSVVYAGVAGPGDSAPAGTLLSGVPLSVLVFAGAPARRPLFHNFSAYAQDAWRVTPRLVVTYGLRWELNAPPRESTGRHPVVVQGLFEDSRRLAAAPAGTPLWRTTYANFAPRYGAAYLLSSRPGAELVLRGGFGLFYDLGAGQAGQAFGSVAPYVAAKIFTNTPFPLTPAQAAPPPLDGAPPYATVVAFDPRLKLPRTVQWNVTLERSLGARQYFSASYVGAAGRRLHREEALVAPNPDFSLVRVTVNAARSDYRALQAQFGRRLAGGAQALVSYTLSRSVDDASSDSLSRLRGNAFGFGAAPANALLERIERRPSDFDVRHSLAAALTYNLPAPRGGGFARGALRGWSLDAIFRARTATPVNVINGTGVTNEGLLIELGRPDVVPGMPFYVTDPNAGGGRRLNRAAFAPPRGATGTLPYNALRGFGLSQLDVALRRDVPLGERLRLQLRAEAFNALNRANFGNPVGDLSSPLFGESVQTFARSLGSGGINGGLSPLYQIGGPRSVQLAAKLQF